MQMTMEAEKREQIRSEGADFIKGLSAVSLQTHASSAAFFFFLALIPILILATTFLPYTGMGESDMVTFITNVTPDIIDSFAMQMVTDAYQNAYGLLPLSAVTLVWTAALGMNAIIRGLNVVYGAGGRRASLFLYFLSFVYTLLMLAAIFVVQMLTIFDHQLNELLVQHFPHSALLAFLTRQWHYLMAFVLTVLFFLFIYTLMPTKKQRFTHQIPGAVFASVAWVVFSYFFSLYIGGANKYISFYGSLATIAIFLFWIYCCIYILLLGGYINKRFEMRLQMNKEERANE